MVMRAVCNLMTINLFALSKASFTAANFLQIYFSPLNEIVTGKMFSSLFLLCVHCKPSRNYNGLYAI